MGAKLSVLGLIMPFFPYLRSAMVRFPFTILKKKLERFGLYLTRSKNGLSIVFSNLARKGSRVFFQARKLFFCPMACIYLLNSRGGPRSFDFHHHL